MIALIMLFCMTIVEAAIIDKGGTLDSSTRNKISSFGQDTGYELSVVIENYIAAPEEHAIKQYNKNEQDILLLYVIQNKSTVIVQPGEDILTNTQLKDIGQNREGQRTAIKNNQDINMYIRNIISAIETEIVGEETESDIEFELPVGKKPASCAFLKDGICDPDCENDPDCECGDGTCQLHESSATCPTDCGEEKDITCGILRNNICDPECDVRDIDCKAGALAEWLLVSDEKEEVSMTYYLIMGTLIVALVICSIIALLLVHNVIGTRQE